MIGVELIHGDGSPSPRAAAIALERARENGLLIGKGGRNGNVLRIAPPLTLSIAEAEEGAAQLEDALRQAQTAIGGVEGINGIDGIGATGGTGGTGAMEGRGGEEQP